MPKKQKEPDPIQKIQDEIITFFQQWKPNGKDDFISLEKIAGDPVIKRKADLAHNVLTDFERYVTGAVLSSKKNHSGIALQGSYSEFIELSKDTPAPNTSTIISLLYANVPSCLEIYKDLLIGNGYPSDRLLNQISNDGHGGFYHYLLALVIYYDLFPQFKQISLAALLRMDYVGQCLMYEAGQMISDRKKCGKYFDQQSGLRNINKDRDPKSEQNKKIILDEFDECSKTKMFLFFKKHQQAKCIKKNTNINLTVRRITSILEKANKFKEKG